MKLQTTALRCVNCGNKLRRCKLREYRSDLQWGDYGDGHVCGLRCGYNWAMLYLSKHPEYAERLHVAMNEHIDSREGESK